MLYCWASMSLDTGQKEEEEEEDVGNKTWGLYNGKFTYLKHKWVFSVQERGVGVRGEEAA